MEKLMSHDTTISFVKKIIQYHPNHDEVYPKLFISF